jgi:hypothetical protein
MKQRSIVINFTNISRSDWIIIKSIFKLLKQVFLKRVLVRAQIGISIDAVRSEEQKISKANKIFLELSDSSDDEKFGGEL